jgi:hypothetical protein
MSLACQEVMRLERFQGSLIGDSGLLLPRGRR